MACKRAKVSRGTYYNWRERYEKNGFAGLEKCKSKTPKKTRKVSKEIEEKVIEKRRKNPEYGKQRITDELAKENDWKPVVSPNTVKRILEGTGLWGRKEEKTAKKEENVCRHAEGADQSYNVDLCYVPTSHESEEKLPAVSGSSGHLKIENVQKESHEKVWPGRVFEDQTLSYEEAMKSFVERSSGDEEEQVATSDGMKEEPSEQEIRKAEKRALNQEADELRVERRKIRMNRQIEDDAWREMRAERKDEVEAYKALSKEEQKQVKEAKRAAG